MCLYSQDVCVFPWATYRDVFTTEEGERLAVKGVETEEDTIGMSVIGCDWVRMVKPSGTIMLVFFERIPSASTHVHTHTTNEQTNLALA